MAWAGHVAREGAAHQGAEREVGAAGGARNTTPRVIAEYGVLDWEHNHEHAVGEHRLLLWDLRTQRLEDG